MSEVVNEALLEMYFLQALIKNQEPCSMIFSIAA